MTIYPDDINPSTTPRGYFAQVQLPYTYQSDGVTRMIWLTIKPDGQTSFLRVDYTPTEVEAHERIAQFSHQWPGAGFRVLPSSIALDGTAL